MSRVCSICGKGKMGGHLVSHSNIKTNRQWAPNIQKVKVEIDGKDTTITTGTTDREISILPNPLKRKLKGTI